MSHKTAFVLATIIALIASTASAQEVDTDQWACEFCPFEAGQRTDFELGATSVSDDSAYFGDATGYDEQGVYANVDGSGSFSSSEHQLQWRVEDLGLDSRFATLSGGRQGTFDYDLSYRQIPQHKYITSDSIFLTSGDGDLALPSGWVRAPVTSGFTELGTSLTERDIESERRTMTLGASYLPSDRFRISANLRRHERDGLDVYGGSYFTQSSLLPGAFDYATDIVELGIRYAGQNSVYSIGYFASEFDNSSAELRWENPFTSSPGAEVGSLATPPDNTFQQVSLAGQHRFSKIQTVASFRVALGRMQQNEKFLPYTTNTALGAAPLPRSSLNAEVDTTNVVFSLSSRLSSKARFKFAYRYDERDNQTTQDLWTRVIAESFISGEPELNVPYSFERSSLKLSAQYQLFEKLKIAGGYERYTIDRDYQEVAEQTEDTGWGRLRWQPGSAWNIDLKAGASERNIDEYNEGFAGSLGQNPLLRKYNLAYRYRQFGEVAIAVSPAELPISATVSATFADDEYTKSQMGITAADDFRVAADLSWTISENATVYVNGGFENIESEQFGSEFFADPDWQAINEDRFYTFGGGIRLNQIRDKVDLQFDYTRSDGISAIDMTSLSGGASSFPDLQSTMDYLRLRLAYQHSDELQFTMNLRYQTISVDDWSLAGVEPATVPVVLTLGADPYDEEVLIFGLGVRYSFGGSGSANTE